MAQLNEILTQEKKRVNETQLRDIYLYAEGSFLRAYEWSAWLCVRYVSKFSVTKMIIKSINEPMVFIGFPITSLAKFTPEGAVVEQREDKLIVMTLHESSLPKGDDIVEQMQTDLANWKLSVPLKETLTLDQLHADLHQAYLDARRHKRNKPYQQRFEANLEINLKELCAELWNRTYSPRPSTCFIISDPKKREVFAAAFRDRIVHHLYYNYVHEMLERTFIADSYSCIRDRGTHYGIRRLEQHIRKESQNYQEPCYVLKLDIQGYFMHINRQRLLDITLRSLHRIALHRVSKYRKELWCELVDMDFVDYLTREIVLLDPTKDCQIRGDAADWDALPSVKSL